MLIAKAEPSCGSVPEPNSSNNTKLLEVAFSKMFEILLI